MVGLTRPTARIHRQQAQELLARGLPPVDVAALVGSVSARERRSCEGAGLAHADEDRLQLGLDHQVVIDEGRRIR